MKLTDLKSSRVDVLKLYKKNLSDLEEDISILREWVSKRPHLPREKLHDEFLTITLLRNKFSIEKTKRKLENYCTHKIKNRYKYLYEDYELIPRYAREAKSNVPILNLTKDYKRVVIAKVWDSEKWDLKLDVTMSNILTEILLRYDYNDGYISVIDWSDCTLGTFVSKFRANVASDISALKLEAHSARIKQVHMINHSASALFNMVKHLIPSKILSKVVVHEDVRTIKDHIPLDCLPKDYGGNLKSLKELAAEWNGLCEAHWKEVREYLETKAEGGADDRIFDDELQGTFKNINID